MGKNWTDWPERQKPGFGLACCFSWPVQCPAAAPVVYKFSITAATVYKGITGFIDCRAARARRLLEVARPRPVQALARGQCRRPPAVLAPPQPANAAKLMVPAEARREARSTRQCPTATIKAVEDLEARSQKFPPNLNQSPKCSSGTRGPKQAWKPEARIEAQSARRSRNLGCRCYCRL